MHQLSSGRTGIRALAAACAALALLLSQPLLAKDTTNMYPGIITSRLAETKAFYMGKLGFEVRFENEWFVLLHRDNREIGFLLPEQPGQAPIFRKAFRGEGVWITIEVPDVDAEYARVRALGVPIEVEIRDEPWGERHFSLKDPNGIGVDIVTYAPAQK